jgi:hypothetical protein
MPMIAGLREGETSMRLIIAAALLATLVPPVSATENVFGFKHWDSSDRRPAPKAVRRAAPHRHVYKPPVYSYQQRIQDEERQQRPDLNLCLPRTVNVMSDQHKGEDRSRNDAIRKWEAKVQWSGGGGEFMNFENAEDKEWRCGPSDPHDSITGRLSQAVGKATATITGNDTEGRNVRCELWAKPCRAPRQRDADGSRRP